MKNTKRAWLDRVEEAAVLVAAWQVGLLEPLAVGASSQDLAREGGLDPEALALLLRALVAIGAVEERHGRFGLAPALSEISPVGAGPFATVWSGLPEFLRSGVSSVSFGGSAADRGATYGQMVGALGDWFTTEAAQLARALDPVASILDLGAGSAVWSLAMAALSPETRVVGVDRPEVVPVMRGRALALGLSIDARSGDLLEIPLPVVERVVLANVLHLEGPVEVRRILARARDALQPGGQLVIVDLIPREGDPDSVREAALYGIQLALRVPTGAVYSQSQLGQWLELEGFGPPERIGLGEGHALAALVAVRR